MSVVLWECSWLSKIYSDLKFRVSEVKNSGDIFTLFSPQSKVPFSKTVRESCHLIRVRPKNNLYLAPRSIGFDGKVFYSLWQEMEPPQLVVIHIHKLLHSIGLVPVRSSPAGHVRQIWASGPVWVRHSYVCPVRLSPDVLIKLFCFDLQNNFMSTSCKNW